MTAAIVKSATLEAEVLFHVSPRLVPMPSGGEHGKVSGAWVFKDARTLSNQDAAQKRGLTTLSPIQALTRHTQAFIGGQSGLSPFLRITAQRAATEGSG
jgi:hypothetical protein